MVIATNYIGRVFLCRNIIYVLSLSNTYLLSWQFNILIIARRSLEATTSQILIWRHCNEICFWIVLYGALLMMNRHFNGYQFCQWWLSSLMHMGVTRHQSLNQGQCDNSKGYICFDILSKYLQRCTFITIGHAHSASSFTFTVVIWWHPSSSQMSPL